MRREGEKICNRLRLGQRLAYRSHGEAGNRDQGEKTAQIASMNDFFATRG
jgi:hypothetical protein